MPTKKSEETIEEGGVDGSTQSRSGGVRGSKPRRWKWKIGLVVVLLLVGFGVWSFMSLQKTKRELADVEGAGVERNLSDEEIADLVAEVGELIKLPEEQPTVAFIENAAQIKQNQAFFKDASDGDQVLIFPQAAKAVIYNPETKQLINVGPITTAGRPQQAPVAQEVVPAEPISIEVRNGSGVAGRAGAVSEELQGADELFQISGTTNATSTEPYTGSLVVNLTGGDNPLVAKLAGLLAARVVSELPEGESASGSDVVVIVGRDAGGSDGSNADGSAPDDGLGAAETDDEDLVEEN